MGFDLDTLVGKTVVQWVRGENQGFDCLYLLFDDGFAICIYSTRLTKDLKIYELSMGEKEDIFGKP